MLKFNNDHIFTGYLKQFLSQVNLPRYFNGEWLGTKDPAYY